MKVRCKCGKEDIGRYWKLIKRGWLVIFIDKGARIERCPMCKPFFWDRKKYFKVFKSPEVDNINKEIKEKVDKIRLLKNL